MEGMNGSNNIQDNNGNELGNGRRHGSTSRVDVQAMIDVEMKDNVNDLQVKQKNLVDFGVREINEHRDSVRKHF